MTLRSNYKRPQKLRYRYNFHDRKGLDDRSAVLQLALTCCACSVLGRKEIRAISSSALLAKRASSLSPDSVVGLSSMAESSSDTNYSHLVARWNELMAIRRFLETNQQSPANVDTDIAKAFNTEAHDTIAARLLRANKLTAMAQIMEGMSIDIGPISLAVANIFESTSIDIFEKEIAKWEQLVEMRTQMREVEIDTRDIECFIAQVFTSLVCGPRFVLNHHTYLSNSHR